MPTNINFNNSLGIAKNSIVINKSSVDPDAQAFITEAGITDATQKTAINTLVVSLKSNGLWTKMSAIYPFVGGTATTHKYNLKNPLDTNAAFRLVFNGGGTHSVNGYQTNGTNAFAETYYNPSINLTSQNSNHISIYSRTNNQGGADMGGGAGAVLMDLELNYAALSYNWNMASYFSHTNSDSRGYYINTRTASNAFKLLKNGSTVLGSSTGAAGATKPNITYHIGKRNYDLLWTNRQYAFASIGDGLTDTNASNLYTAVQAFNTSLGRSVGPQTVSDADAQAFVNAANIQDQVQADAVNNLVIGLKADGLWTKMKAIYPFVGGDATSHKFNLKNPLDTDAAFRLVFSGGITHNSNGVTGNGTNGFADTFLNDQTDLSIDNKHISIYQRNILPTTSGSSMGIANSNRFYLNFSGSNYSTLGMNQSPFAIQTPQQGMFIMSKIITNEFKYYQNALTPVTKTGTNNPQNLKHFILACNNGGSGFDYSLANIAFSSVGDGLTDTDAANLYTKVQAFNTTLGRQI